ncbi:MAG: TPR end-of-group domain-containing protein [Steroidobacteraceae bacterium]
MVEGFVIGEFEIEPATRRLRRCAGELVHLANRPFQVLLYLVVHHDRIVPRSELIEQFWDGRDVYEDALTRCLSTVRKALDDQASPARYVETRWTEGYRFVGPCEEIAAAPRAAHAMRAARGPAGGRKRVRYSSRIDSTATDRLVRRGNSYLSRFGLRNQRYALEMFRAALAFDPDDYRAWAGMAASHSLQYLHAERLEHHWNGAIRAMKEALERKTDSAESQIARAHVAVMRGDYVEADAAFAFAESLSPRLFQAWYYHGRVCAESREHDRAVGLYEKASAADEFDCQASALCELSLKRLGLRKDARRTAAASVKAAERTLRRRPDDVRSLSLGGCMLPGLGRRQEGRRWTERALALEPEEPYVNLNAACALTLLGEFDLALDYLRRVPLSPVGNCKWIAHDPSFDPLREHPRFTAMMTECGKPRGAAASAT